MDLRFFKTDPSVEVDGFWHDVADSRLKIARIGNPVYKRLVRERLSPQIRRRLTEEEQENVLGTILGECILVGWENVQESGKELPYTKEAAIRLMTSPEYHDFRDIVSYLAEKEEFYRVDFIEGVKKKLSNGSDGDQEFQTEPSKQRQLGLKNRGK